VTGPAGAPVRRRFSIGEGIALSVLTLAGGGFTVVGASANAPLIRAGLHLSEVGVGAIAAFAYLGAMVTSRTGGRFTDRLGPTIVIFAGMTAMASGTAVAALAPGAVVFYLGVLLAGLGYGVVNPATNVLANPSSARRRGLVMSVKQAGVPLGGIVAGAVQPFIGSAYGWRWAFLAPFLVCAGVAVLVQVRGSRRAVAHGHDTDVLRSSVYLRLPHGFGYGFVMAGAQVSIFAFTTVYLVEARGLAPGRAGLGISLLLLGGVAGRPMWGWLSDLYPDQRLRVLQATSLLGGVAICSVWAAPAYLLPVALAAVGVCSVGWNGVYVAAIAEAGKPHEVGWTTGASLTLINLGAVACPVVIGLIVQLTHSWAWGWSCCAGMNLLGLVVVAASRIDPGMAEA
jgi:MFS family permease